MNKLIIKKHKELLALEKKLAAETGKKVDSVIKNNIPTVGNSKVYKKTKKTVKKMLGVKKKGGAVKRTTRKK
tara:strand:- start:145 stop:360 length:216 start_codon:yes stop_codon:yes gene_type:complete